MRLAIWTILVREFCMRSRSSSSGRRSSDTVTVKAPVRVLNWKMSLCSPSDVARSSRQRIEGLKKADTLASEVSSSAVTNIPVEDESSSLSVDELLDDSHVLLSICSRKTVSTKLEHRCHRSFAHESHDGQRASRRVQTEAEDSAALQAQKEEDRKAMEIARRVEAEVREEFSKLFSFFCVYFEGEQR